MSYYMLATFADAFRDAPDPKRLERLRSVAGAKPAQWQGARLDELEPQEMERLLAGTVLREFKIRLERIGIEYQTPARP